MSFLPPGNHERSLTVGPYERMYLVHVPIGDAPSANWPVVLAFHGGGSNPAQMADFSGLSTTADKHGFVVVYPGGTGIIAAARTFNAGNCCGRALRLGVDEIAFVTAMLADLSQLIPLDQQRIYATGMSNGALLAYHVADKLSHRIAAIAPVAGPMGFATCSPTEPVSVVHFHGTADAFAPYTGGIGRKSVSKTNFFSVEQSLAAWVNANGCASPPCVDELPPQVDDGTRVTRHVHGHGHRDAEVVLYQIHGMGHTWPGRETPFPALGRVTHNLDANEVLWAFFKKHPKSDTTAVNVGPERGKK